MEQTDPLSYNVKVGDQVWHHHSDQILECSSANAEPEADVYLPASETAAAPTVSKPQSPPAMEQGLLLSRDPPNNAQTSVQLEQRQYPRRERRPPDRLTC